MSTLIYRLFHFFMLSLMMGALPLWADGVFDEKDLAILDLSYKRQLIGNGLDVYLTDDSFYIPLEDFIFAMELNIEPNADGFEGVQGDGALFSLKQDGEDWLVTLGDQGQRVFNEQQGLIVEFDGLVYVEKSLVTDWFGVTMQLEFSESTLNIDFTKPIPVQARLARRNRKISEQDYLAEPSLPVLSQPYALFEVPSLDARVSYSATRNEDERIRNYRSVIYSGRTVGDFLGMSTETLISGSRDNGLVGGSIKMERFDSSRSMLGPLGLSQISLGDVSSPSTGLSGSAYGRGILLGNDLISSGKSRDIRDIEGDFYPEWEVELYLNNTLVGYQITDETGHYKFSDVVLFQGVNRFTLKFYGPHGEREEQQRQIVVGDDPENEAPFRYTVSLSQPGKSVLNVDGRDTGSSGDYRAAFFARMQATSNVSLKFSLEEIHIESADNLGNGDFIGAGDFDAANAENQQGYDDQDVSRYYGAGMQIFFGGLSFNLDGTIEERVRKSGALGVSGVIGGAAIYASTTHYSYVDGYDNYLLDSEASNILNSYSLAINKRFNALSFVLNNNYENYEKSSKHTADFGLSTRLGWVNWNNTLSYLNEKHDEVESSEEKLENANLKQLLGATFFSTSYRYADFRIGGVYTTEPSFEFTNANASTALRLADKINLDISASHSLINDETFYRIGLNWIADSFRLTPSISYNDSGRWQGMVQLSTSLGKRNGRLGEYYKPTSNPAIIRGAVRARLFEDKNADGVYQRGELLLSGGEISAVQARRKARSNQAGVAWLELMPSWDRSDVVINSNSINEGYMALGREPFSVIPRPGRVTEVDIPFLRVGEIDGNVEIIDGENSFPGIGIYLELVDAKGEIAELGRSDSGGYFNFALVKPGTYSLRAKDYTLIKVIPQKIIIDGTGNFEEGVRVLVEPKPYEGDLDDPFSKSSPLEAPSGVEEEKPTNSEAGSSETSRAPINVTSSSFNGIEPSVVEQKIENSVPVPPIFNVPTVNQAPKVSPAVNKGSGDVVTQPSFPVKNDSESQTFWAVQTGSFSQEPLAEELVEKIREQGFSAQMQAVDLPAGRFYRVFANGFIDSASAVEAKQSLDTTFNIKSIVKKM